MSRSVSSKVGETEHRMGSWGWGEERKREGETSVPRHPLAEPCDVTTDDDSDGGSDLGEHQPHDDRGERTERGCHGG